MLTKSKKISIAFLKFLLFTVCILLFGSSVIDLSIKTAYPFIVLALLVASAVFSKLSHCAFAGFICGAFVDSITSGTYCFNTITLMLLAVAACLFSDNVFNKNLKATITLCFICTFVYYLCYWLLFIRPAISTTANPQYILQYAIPSSLYTTVFVIPFYFIYKYWHRICNEK